MSRVYIDLLVLLFGVRRVLIAHSTHRSHRSHSPGADDAVAEWSHMQKWVGVGLLRCNAGIFLSVVTDWQF
jgi:hypothetical protein